VLGLIPPSLYQALSYKSSEYNAFGAVDKVKGMMRYCFTVKFFLGLCAVAFYIILGWLLYQYSDPVFSRNGYCLMILSPIALLYELGNVIIVSLDSLRYYGTNTFIQTMNKITLVIGSVFIYLFDSNLSQMDILTAYLWVNVIALIVQFLTAYISYLFVFHNVKLTPVKWEEIKIYSIFGLYFSLSSSIIYVYQQIYNVLLSQQGGQVYSNIPENMTNQATIVSQLPMSSVFTELEKKGNRKQLVQLFTRSSELYTIIVSFLIGILFFGINAYVLLIYASNYWDIVDMVRLYVFVVYFTVLVNNYHGLFAITKLEPKFPLLDGIAMIFYTIITLVLNYYLNFLGLILAQVFGNLVWFLVYWMYDKWVLKEFKIPFIILTKNFIVLFILILIITWVSPYILQNPAILSFGNSLVQYINKIGHIDLTSRAPGLMESAVSLILFSLGFYLYVLISRSITKEDIETIQNSGVKIPLSKLIKKLVLHRKMKSESDSVNLN
jgi:O-antigen/teichoic acid export membrane protein